MSLRKIASNPLAVWFFSGIPGLIRMSSTTSSETAGEEEAKKGLKPINLVTCGITAGVCAVLAMFAIIIVPIPGIPGGSGLWLPAGFYFTFTLWFGIWGALGGHIATTIAMGYFLGYTLTVWLDGGMGDFLAPLVALLIFRALKADPGLKTGRDMGIWVVSVPLASLVCGIWVHSVNAYFGVIPWEYWWVGVVSYLVGDSIAVFCVATPLLKVLTKYVKRTPAYVEGFFS